jgi:3' terminal RNA ribose 2'-O-methyltransferase Hen1
VLDEEKHYWVGRDEIDKLLAKGVGWLESHPARAAITRRYLRWRPPLIRSALARLADAETPAPGEDEGIESERTLSLNEQRMGTVVSILKASGATRVLDLGCGEGNLVARLVAEREFVEVLGVDVSATAVVAASRRIERLPSRDRGKARVIQGSLLYRDERLAGWDAAALVEVIEHIEPDRLPQMEREVFGGARPATVVVTTPNRDYNARFEGLESARFRHGDHRFEWSRGEFEAWIARIEAAYPYRGRQTGIGDADAALGPPTQAVVFERWS